LLQEETELHPLLVAQPSTSLAKDVGRRNGTDAASLILGDATLDLDLPGAFNLSRILDRALIQALEKSAGQASTILAGELKRFRFQAINGLAQSGPSS
jgi:hypothetical protein